MEGEDADGMTVWLTSGSCLHQCLLIGGGCMQIYSDFEQALLGSNRHLKTPYFLVARGLRFDPPLAFLSQLALALIYHGGERPKVHAIFIVEAIVMTYISTNLQGGLCYGGRACGVSGREPGLLESNDTQKEPKGDMKGGDYRRERKYQMLRRMTNLVRSHSSYFPLSFRRYHMSLLLVNSPFIEFCIWL